MRDPAAGRVADQQDRLVRVVDRRII